jgi:vacuolar-type H+-ATPase subunit E/Vma4
MEPQERDKAALISDIESDARAEAEGIIKEAENQAEEKRRYARKQAESILNDARAKAREQAEAIEKKAVRDAQREAKKKSMLRKAAVVQEVLDRVEQRLATMVERPEYRSILIDWIVEAGIGLGAQKAEVNASEKERALIDDGLLAEATDKIHAATGNPIALTLSDSAPLPAQGVFLTAADGRTAFNNQAKTRMLRSQRKIHALIHDCLFGNG